jgi:adenosylhomocysteinase
VSKKASRAIGDVKNLNLAGKGIKRIEWANHDMPVLQLVRDRFEKERPLKGLKLSACLHVTAETANLMRTLKAGGADIALCASNPLSTQDDVAAAICKEFEIPVFAIRGEDRDTYYSHLKSALDHKPQVTMDDGADLVSLLHEVHRNPSAQVIASMEETTTGVIRLRAMEKDGALKIPVVAVNDADTKHFFDNRYGTGQSTVAAVLDNTNLTLAGTPLAVLGYGWCGRGIARAAAALGARVLVVEPDPVKALEARCDGHLALDLEAALRSASIVVTATGASGVIGAPHFQWLRDGAVLANAGAFEDEIDVPALRRAAVREQRSRAALTTFQLADGRRVDLIAHGDQVNLAAAEGHPVEIMDLTFAVVLRAVAWLVQGRGHIPAGLHRLPDQLDQEVARAKLAALGIAIDSAA